MNKITCSVETLLNQASGTTKNYFLAAVETIDSQFGEGFAKENPLLIGSLVQAAAQDFHTSMLCAVIQDTQTLIR